MCRNITELRGLEPAATREEIEAASFQFVRKITGVSRRDDRRSAPSALTLAEPLAPSLTLAGHRVVTGLGGRRLGRLRLGAVRAGHR